LKLCTRGNVLNVYNWQLARSEFSQDADGDSPSLFAADQSHCSASEVVVLNVDYQERFSDVLRLGVST
jgi:hypothetical protein